MSGISSHILDTNLGRPAADVAVSLLRSDAENTWTQVGTGVTDGDGRCRQLLPEGATLSAGIYRIRFDVAAYYERYAIQGLYPVVEITFRVRTEDQHLHIPLLLTANGYTTYRGS